MAGDLKLILAQFREVEGFTKLGLVLDDATTQLVNKGGRLTSFLIQKRFQPSPVYEQILCLYPAIKGHLAKIDASLINVFELEFKNWFATSCFKKPLSSSLTSMIFPAVIVNFMIWYFVKYFVLFIEENFTKTNK